MVIKSSAQAKFSKDIDRFSAPDFSGLDLPAYYSPETVVPLLLSRGCYWRKCTFCTHYFSSGDNFRLHSVEYAIDMVKKFKGQGIENFSFVDEMISPRFLERFSDALLKEKLEISYYAMAKPNRSFLTPGLFDKMAKTGCKYLIWGVESGCQRVLDLMGKGTIKEDVAEVLQAAHEAGIVNHIFLISGFPTETNEEFSETVDFLYENSNAIYGIHRGTFILTEDSPIWCSPEQFSITTIRMSRNDPLGKMFSYECSQGVSQQEANANLQSALPFFREIHPFAKLMPTFRDHSLLLYKQKGPELRMVPRYFSPRSSIRTDGKMKIPA